MNAQMKERTAGPPDWTRSVHTTGGAKINRKVFHRVRERSVDSIRNPGRLVIDRMIGSDADAMFLAFRELEILRQERVGLIQSVFALLDESCDSVVRTSARDVARKASRRDWGAPIASAQP